MDYKLSNEEDEEELAASDVCRAGSVQCPESCQITMSCMDEWDSYGLPEEGSPYEITCRASMVIALLKNRTRWIVSNHKLTLVLLFPPRKSIKDIVGMAVIAERPAGKW